MPIKPLNQRGQLFSADLLLALGLFITLLLLMIAAFSYFDKMSRDEILVREMAEDAVDAVDALLSGPGSPPHWPLMASLDDVNALGLLDSSGNLDDNKLAAFGVAVTSDANAVKDLLALQGRNFFVEGLELDGDSIFSYGSQPDTNVTNFVALRPARHQNQTILVRFTVWE